jgi:hypothetical protein
VFWQMVELGRELRGYHLMETISMADMSAAWLQYPVDGDNMVEKPQFVSSPLTWAEIPASPLIRGGGEAGGVWQEVSEGVLWSVYINSTQYISWVSQTAREFYIGGYQPAQKRLKDRKWQTLTYDDIIHYQQIIVSLSQTARVMQEIDEVFSL